MSCLLPFRPLLACCRARVGEEEHLIIPSCIPFFCCLPHLQLPPFLLTTMKANSSHSSPFPPAQDELSNRMDKQAKLNQNKPSLLHLNKTKQNKQKLWTVRTCCSKHAFLDLFSDLHGCSLLSPKDTSLIDHRLHARNAAFLFFFFVPLRNPEKWISHLERFVLLQNWAVRPLFHVPVLMLYWVCSRAVFSHANLLWFSVYCSL